MRNRIFQKTVSSMLSVLVLLSFSIFPATFVSADPVLRETSPGVPAVKVVPVSESGPQPTQIQPIPNPNAAPPVPLSRDIPPPPPSVPRPAQVPPSSLSPPRVPSRPAIVLQIPERISYLLQKVFGIIPKYPPVLGVHGDPNLDGGFDEADLKFIERYVIKGENIIALHPLISLRVRVTQTQQAQSDLNGDGGVNYFDILVGRDFLGGKVKSMKGVRPGDGDVNGDGLVGAVDITLLRRYLAGTATLSLLQLARADVNRDGSINVLDLVLIQAKILQEIQNFPRSDASFPVEPPTLVYRLLASWNNYPPSNGTQILKNLHLDLLKRLQLHPELSSEIPSLLETVAEKMMPLGAVQEAQKILTAFGYTGPVVFTAFSFDRNSNSIRAKVGTDWRVTVMMNKNGELIRVTVASRMLADGTIQYFNDQGKLVKQISSDPAGTTLVFEYDSEGRIVRIVKHTGVSASDRDAQEIVFDFITGQAVQTFRNGIRLIYDFESKAGSPQNPVILGEGRINLVSWITDPATGAYETLVGSVKGGSYLFESNFIMIGQPINDSRRVFFNFIGNEGNLYDENRNSIGSYVFYPFRDDQGNERFVLKMVHHYRGTGFNPPLEDTRLFFVPPDRSRFLLIAPAPYWVFHGDLDPAGTFWPLAAKFFRDPLALSAKEYSALGQFNGGSIVKTNFDFRNPFVPIYLHRLLDALAERPGFEFSNTNTDFLPHSIYSLFNNGVESSQKREVVEHLSRVWQTLSLPVKKNFLEKLNTGNRATVNLLGRLIVEYIGEIEAAYPSPLPRLEFLAPLLPTIENVIKSLGLDPELRSGIIKRVFRQYNSTPSFAVLSFVYKALVKGDGIIVDLWDYKEEISGLVRLYLSQPDPHPAGLLVIFNLPPEFIGPASIDLLEGYVERVMSKFDGDPMTVNFLLACLNGPVSQEKKERIENLLARDGFEPWMKHSDSNRDYYNLYFILKGYSNLPPIHSLGFTPSVLDRFFRETAGALAARFEERGLDDRWGTPYDHSIYQFIRLMKASADFDQYAPYLVDVLHKFNPRQTGESEKQYSGRLLQIEELWLKQRIFTNDLNGGIFTAPGYLDVIANYGTHHRGWVHVLVLSTQEGGEGKPGVVQLNWKYKYTTPYTLSYGLLHEGTHALVERHEEGTRVMDFLIRYWFYEHEKKDMNNVPSYYASANPTEYPAEFVRHWQADTKKWLETALQRYSQGLPALLNMFVFIWDMTRPADAPQGMLPFYTLLPEETGLLQEEWTQAEWQAGGDIKNGNFRFKLGEKTYLLTFRNYLITNVTVEG